MLFFEELSRDRVDNLNGFRNHNGFYSQQIQSEVKCSGKVWRETHGYKQEEKIRKIDNRERKRQEKKKKRDRGRKSEKKREIQMKGRRKKEKEGK